RALFRVVVDPLAVDRVFGPIHRLAAGAGELLVRPAGSGDGHDVDVAPSVVTDVFDAGIDQRLVVGRDAVEEVAPVVRQVVGNLLRVAAACDRHHVEVPGGAYVDLLAVRR